MLTILFDGVAYGMLLFVLACGLAVTLGLMNFVNLAHGAFAMAGGYFTVVLVFMSVAAVDYVMGSQQQFVGLPAALQGRYDVLGVGIGKYRLLIIVICGALTA